MAEEEECAEAAIFPLMGAGLSGRSAASERPDDEARPPADSAAAGPVAKAELHEPSWLRPGGAEDGANAGVPLPPD